MFSDSLNGSHQKLRNRTSQSLSQHSSEVVVPFFFFQLSRNTGQKGFNVHTESRKKNRVYCESVDCVYVCKGSSLRWIKKNIYSLRHITFGARCPVRSSVDTIEFLLSVFFEFKVIAIECERFSIYAFSRRDNMN